MIESILLGDVLRRPPYLDWFELAAALAAGLAVIGLLRYARPMRGVAVAMVIVAAFFGVELALFRFADLLFDSTFPVLTLLAVLVRIIRTSISMPASSRREWSGATSTITC